MAKEKKVKEPKPRAEKYEEKLKVNATFEQAIKILIKPKKKKE